MGFNPSLCIGGLQVIRCQIKWFICLVVSPLHVSSRCGTSDRRPTCTRSPATPTPWQRSNARRPSPKSSQVETQRLWAESGYDWIPRPSDVDECFLHFPREPRFHHQAVGSGGREDQSHADQPQEVRQGSGAASSTVRAQFDISLLGSALDRTLSLR